MIEQTSKIREYILTEARKRAEMLGTDDSTMKKIAANEQSLVDVGLFDSLSFLDLLGALEDKFEIEIDLGEYDLEYFLTLEGLTKIVADSSVKNNSEISANKIFPVIIDEIEYVGLTPSHQLWNELPRLFDALYEYQKTLNLFVPLKVNGSQLWLKSLENGLGKTQIVVGALDGENLVGYCHGILKILPTYLEGGYIGELSSIYVVPEYRKRKIADRMDESIYQWLKSQNVTSIEVSAITDNTAGIGLWLERGYKKELVQLRKMIDG